MPHPSDLAPNYIDLTDYNDRQGDRESEAMSLTILAAASVSELAYCRTAEQLGTEFDDPRHSLARELDAVTAVWMLPSIRIDQGPDERVIELPALVLAWSNRLRIRLLGFCGTRNLDDACADIRITQTADPDLASRFHTGFYARAMHYYAAVAAFARDHDMVLCGHSLGGALATIVAYTLLARGNRTDVVRNTWWLPSVPWAAESPARSVITFGAPAMMVIENALTTARPKLSLRQTMHHIINAHDMVPFVLSYAMRWAGPILSAGQNLLSTKWPTLGPAFATLSRVLQTWADSRRSFAHFGCLHLLVRRTYGQGPDMICHQVTSLDAFPATPTSAPVQDYHRMSHYLQCVRETIDIRPDPGTRARVDPRVLATLQLPSQPQSSRIRVYDDRIVLSLEVNAPLVPYIITSVSCRLNNADTVPDSCIFEQTRHCDPVTMTIEQKLRVDGNQTVPQILETLRAMSTSLTISDCFGHKMTVRVADTDVDLAELRDLGMSSTFESLRRAMIAAFADVIARVQRLKLEESEDISQDNRQANRRQAGRLLDPAHRLSSILDELVASAVPALVVARLPHALWLVKKLWDGDDDSQAPGTQIDANGFSLTNVSVRAREVASLIPTDAGCSAGVRAKLLAMLQNFDRASHTHLLPRKLDQEVPLQTRLSNVDTTLGRRPFARALQTYGEQLYSRSPNAAIAIEEARTQSQEVMDVMRACHAIILTQLDAPFEWLVRQTRFFPPIGQLVAGVNLDRFEGPTNRHNVVERAIISCSALKAMSVSGHGAGAAVGAAAVAGKSVAESIHKLRAWRKRIEIRYDDALTITRQALNLNLQPFDSIRETAIAERLQADLGAATEMNTLSRWKSAVSTGLANMGDRNPIALYFHAIGDFWAKWLFDVARVSQLRTCLASRVSIGVEGPTEAGKSEFLTMLTGAPCGVFASGNDVEHRTTEIQSWMSPTGRRAIFYDFPGSDDRDVELRNVARLCREMLDIVIFVVPCAASRAASRVPILDEIAAFINARQLDMRPFIILVNKVDELDYHRSDPQRFTNSVAERRAEVVTQLQDRLGVDVVIHSHRASSVNVAQHPTLIHIGRSSLDDVVLAYSSHAQRSYDEPRALSDCPPGTDYRMQEAAKQHHLYTMAEEGVVADVESIRNLLRALSPGCVPNVGRGRQSKMLHGP